MLVQFSNYFKSNFHFILIYLIKEKEREQTLLKKKYLMDCLTQCDKNGASESTI
jgi:hypothetical protein